MDKKRPARVCTHVENVTEDVVAFHQWADFREQIDLLNTSTIMYEQAGRERLALFARYLREGLPIPVDGFDQLCGWLEAIAQGEDPVDVLELKRRPGRGPDPERLERLNRIAGVIWRAHRFGAEGGHPRPLNDGKDGAGAIEYAAGECDVSEGEARLAWGVWGKAWLELDHTRVQGIPNLNPLTRRRKDDP